jgi:hypothetical protein
METPKPMQGTWTLTAPDGRQWQAGSVLITILVALDLMDEPGGF